MEISIGSFRIGRQVSLSVSRICGMPGDHSLEFLKLREGSKPFPFAGACNELNAVLFR
jgi:TPP-dependent 2-oxoacid decarboxylase